MRWDNPEKTTVYEAFEGRWDVKDVHQAMDDFNRLMEPNMLPVDIIVDLTQSQSNPTNLALAAGRADQVLKGRINQLVVIGANYYLQTISTVLTRMIPAMRGTAKFAATMEEARDLLKAQP